MRGNDGRDWLSKKTGKSWRWVVVPVKKVTTKAAKTAKAANAAKKTVKKVKAVSYTHLTLPTKA